MVCPLGEVKAYMKRGNVQKILCVEEAALFLGQQRNEAKKLPFIIFFFLSFTCKKGRGRVMLV